MNQMQTSLFKKFYPAVITAGLSLFPLVSAAQTKLLGIRDIAQSITPLLNTLVVVVFILAVVIFGWGVVRYITAAGDPTKVKEARGFLFWGLIGLVVLASIFGLIRYIGVQLGVETTGGGTFIPPSVSPPGP